jgi:MerR family transcriptional regulator, redox-sensitive transcriptional activator SoxR
VAASYSIGEVASRVGLSTSALRYYETLGLMPPPERASGRRRYDQGALDRLAMIDVAQRAGFTLREVGVLLAGLQADTPPTQEWRDLATNKLAEVEALVTRAEAMRALLQTWLECDCLTLEDIDAFRQANTEWAHAQQETVPPA